ncbi:hypothetical protein NDU88_004574 [Pleurodeles waltl]|uniref:Uncharacterized protein n=1 Tax=Pleurodeles waltl TaxID=8319 RepID=A0AAV7W894_PLEWA|nr:hypothetical protein NDU88_004574 [Pleurodeles waltl]
MPAALRVTICVSPARAPELGVLRPSARTGLAGQQGPSAPLASTGLCFVFAIFCAAGPIPIHRSLATSVRLRVMSSTSYWPSGPSRYLAGCWRLQSEAEVGHMRRIPGPGVLCSQLLWLQHRQPCSFRPQLGLVTGGTT